MQAAHLHTLGPVFSLPRAFKDSVTHKPGPLYRWPRREPVDYSMCAKPEPTKQQEDAVTLPIYGTSDAHYASR